MQRLFHRMKNFGRTGHQIPLILALMLTSCSGGDSPSSTGTNSANPQGTASITQTVSAADGGTLALPTGETLVIPPGALAQDTTITMRTLPSTITVPSDFEGGGPVVELLPDGLTFAPHLPALLTLPVSAPNSGGEGGLIVSVEGTKVVPLSQGPGQTEGVSQQFDPTARTITTPIQHFSSYVVLVAQVGVLKSTKKDEINKIITKWWKKDAIGVPGQVFQLPPELALPPYCCIKFCNNCFVRTESEIKQIIVHSTNDKPGTTFVGLLTFILGSIGQSTEANFATYYIDYDGRIAQLVPDEIRTAHIGGLNSGKIGIELFEPQPVKNLDWTPTAPPPRTGKYTDEQFFALGSLIQSLRATHNLPTNSVCMHREFTTDPLHQDPYHMSNADWQTFLTRLSLVPCSSVKFSQADYSVSQTTAGNATITVTRAGVNTREATVNYTVSNGTAISGTDYNQPSGAVLTFGAGDTTKTFLVPILKNPSNTTSRVANLTLTNPVGVGLGDPQTATLTITSDNCTDPSPNIKVFDYSTGYVHEAKPEASFNLSLPGGSSLSAIGRKGTVGVSASNPGGLTHTADVSVGYRDTFIVTSPGKSGTGQALFSFSPSAAANVSCEFEGDSATQAYGFARAVFSDGVVVAGGELTAYRNCVPQTINDAPTLGQSGSFTYGVSQYIDVQLRAYAVTQPVYNVSASSTASIGYSVTVQGDPDAKVTWCRTAP